MKTRLVLPALLLAAIVATPASANWFSNPYQNVNRYIGSTTNPTPQDIREGRQPVVVENKDASGQSAAAEKPKEQRSWWDLIRRTTAREQQTVAQSR